MILSKLAKFIFKCDIILIRINSFNMAQLKIDDIEQSFDSILEVTGKDSYVNWESFTKNSSEFMKSLDELAKSIAIIKEIQHKKFILTMKKLKSADVPDLIKTVRGKKLPKEALKAIIGRFKLNDGKVELQDSVESLKAESTSILEEYINNNNAAIAKTNEAVSFLKEKIQLSGLYEEPPLPKELVSTFKHNFEEQRLESAKNAIQVQYFPGTVDLIHITTYSQIVDNTFELIKSEYKRLTDEARVKQRPLFNDTPKYLESLIEYLTNTEVLILEGQKTIAAKVGISQQKIEQSQINLMQRGLANNILMIQSALRSKVKESIPARHEVSLQSAKEILNYQVALLKSKVDYFKSLFSGLEKTQENLQLVPMILALALNDMVFEKYKLEEEDIMKEVTDNVILTNPDFTEIFKSMEMEIIKLMENIGVIPQQVSQYMQNQAFVPPVGVNPTQLPPPQVGGVLPGSNPMDLLQFQQLQQFYQMQAAQQNRK